MRLLLVVEGARVDRGGPCSGVFFGEKGGRSLPIGRGVARRDVKFFL